ncbi:hypothetical protein [Blastopirellula marina]|uniref:Uncharacterized protein n=1 Tax=Blastopirellula marina DSM 3645 TaxID=314230 RepID=A3ZM00_9BACT|nr:hypothetical protein [Blastopirellula marina]EAQ82783.1 hypothetical protein DSM3645_10297 [Blastopirellula marina DSM 3645]
MATTTVNRAGFQPGGDDALVAFLSDADKALGCTNDWGRTFTGYDGIFMLKHGHRTGICLHARKSGDIPLVVFRSRSSANWR